MFISLRILDTVDLLHGIARLGSSVEKALGIDD